MLLSRTDFQNVKKMEPLVENKNNNITLFVLITFRFALEKQIIRLEKITEEIKKNLTYCPV